MTRIQEQFIWPFTNPFNVTGPVPAALVEEVLMGGRASPAASAALAAAAASLAAPGATLGASGISALASSALARHIRRPESAGGSAASGAAAAWPGGSAAWLPSGRGGRAAGSAGGCAGGFAGGDAAAGKDEGAGLPSHAEKRTGAHALSWLVRLPSDLAVMERGDAERNGSMSA